MKTTITILSLLLLAGPVSVWAQSGGAGKGQAGAAPVNTTRKVKTGQTEGKGVPYSKDKEQQGRAQAKGGTPPTSGSATGQRTTKPGKKSRSTPRNDKNQ